jgi:hypothetical protein
MLVPTTDHLGNAILACQAALKALFWTFRQSNLQSKRL